jgi:hypothetical protein
MKTETLSELNFKTSVKYFCGFILIITVCFSAETVYGQIVFSDTREQTEKEEMMQMFREAQLISDTFYMRKLDNHLFDILYVNDELLMLADGYFEVFQWQKDTWKQISKSRKGGYNYGGKKFVWNNRIFSYGGYGYWTQHGDLLEFNLKSGNWEKIELPKLIPLGPSYKTDSGFRVLSDTCYEVDILHKTVKTYPVDFPIKITMGNFQAGFKPESSRWSCLLQGAENLYIEKKNNILYYSNLSTEGNKIASLFNHGDFIQFKNDSLIKWSPEGTIITSIKISEMVKLYKRFEIHEKDEHNSSAVLGYVSLLFVLFTFIYFWKIRSKKTSLTVETWQNSVISDLLSVKIESLNTEQLDALLGLSEIVPLEYRKYRRSRTMHEINEEFRTKYGHDLIIRYKDPEDGRRYLYKISNTGKTQNST